MRKCGYAFYPIVELNPRRSINHSKGDTLGAMLSSTSLCEMPLHLNDDAARRFRATLLCGPLRLFERQDKKHRSSERVRLIEDCDDTLLRTYTRLQRNRRSKFHHVSSCVGFVQLPQY